MNVFIKKIAMTVNMALKAPRRRMYLRIVERECDKVVKVAFRRIYTTTIRNIQMNQHILFINTFFLSACYISQ